MLPFALFVLLTDGLLSVPPSHWQSLELPVSAPNSIVDIEFEVTQGSRVQVLVLNRAQAARFERGRSFDPELTTGFQNSGRFRFAPATPGNYVLMVDNRIEGRGPTLVKLRVSVNVMQAVEVRELTPEKRRLVISLSLLFFGAVVVFSARQFLRNS